MPLHQYTPMCDIMAVFLKERCEELARTEVLDTGKPIWEARYDIQGCADTIQYYGGLAPTIVGKQYDICISVYQIKNLFGL